MVRQRGWSAWGAACAMVYGLVLAPPVGAQPQYTVVVLDIGNTRSSLANGINASGQVVGQADVQSSVRPVLWSDDVLTDLGGFPAFGNFALGINDAGQVVGYSHFYSETRAFRWDDGVLTELFGPMGTAPPNPTAGSVWRKAEAHGINASGHVVGQVYYAFPPHNLGTTRAALWKDGTLIELGAFGDTTCGTCKKDDTARAINASGQIVGSAVMPFKHATLWQNGTPTDLGTLGGQTSSATGINASGQIVGWSQILNGRQRAFLWNNGTMINLGTLGDASSYSEALGINAGGQVVGSSTQPVPYDEDAIIQVNDGYLGARGFLWQSGVMYDLNTLVGTSEWTIVEARAINDAGQIAAMGRSAAGIYRALRLDPVGTSTPPPALTWYMAEGATSAFFDTRLAVLNPGGIATTATLTFTPGNGQAITRQVKVPARTRVTVTPKGIPGLAAAEFATRVGSNRRLIVDRTMAWNSAEGYGSHAETAVESPSPIWYLAEGATHNGFELFYLLQNPSSAPVEVRVRYLLPTGAPLEKTYLLSPTSRTNIWVNREEFPGRGQALAATDVSAVIESLYGTPIIVERAMYLTNQGRAFNAGHASMGVTAPATEWFLAEGATGDFFDLFVLIANPTDEEAAVTVTYLLADGTTYQRSLKAPPNSRSNIWVDQERIPGVPGVPLADVAVSTTVVSTNGVPLIVERSMWWPGTSGTWQEAHNAAGSTTTGTRWALAEGEVGGQRNQETYILIANTSGHEGSARVTLMFEDGTSAVRVYPLLPRSRTNVAVRDHFGASVQGKRFGALVESTGDTPAQIVVERAMYSDAGGVTWAAGTNALGTRLP